LIGDCHTQRRTGGVSAGQGITCGGIRPFSSGKCRRQGRKGGKIFHERDRRGREGSRARGTKPGGAMRGHCRDNQADRRSCRPRHHSARRLWCSRHFVSHACPVSSHGTAITDTHSATNIHPSANIHTTADLHARANVHTNANRDAKANGHGHASATYPHTGAAM